jgi:hypothetical protein
MILEGEMKFKKAASGKKEIVYFLTDGDGNVMCDQDYDWEHPELRFSTLKEARRARKVFAGNSGVPVDDVVIVKVIAIEEVVT